MNKTDNEMLALEALNFRDEINEVYDDFEKLENELNMINQFGFDPSFINVEIYPSDELGREIQISIGNYPGLIDNLVRFLEESKLAEYKVVEKKLAEKMNKVKKIHL